MKKSVLVLLLVLALSGVAFAQNVNTQSIIGTSGDKLNNNNQNSNTFLPVNAPVNTNLNTNTNLFTPVNVFTPVQGQNQNQGQLQGQMQGQGQMQNNGQVISPKQTVLFESPTPLPNLPSQYVPELNFGTGRMKDVTANMPNFAIYGIKKYAGEVVLDVLNVNANVKFKNYYKAVLSDAKDLAGTKGFKSSEVRIQVIVAEAQKTWTTGGNLGGAMTGLSGSGLSGGSGAGSIVPQFGGTKADDLFTIIYFKVSQ